MQGPPYLPVPASTFEYILSELRSCLADAVNERATRHLTVYRRHDMICWCCKYPEACNFTGGSHGAEVINLRATTRGGLSSHIPHTRMKSV